MNKEELIIFDWDKVAYTSRMLALNIAKDERPDLVIGITRGGCCIATIISEMLRRNMITVCATRRKNDIEINDKPILITKMDSDLIKGKKVLIVDEIAVTGETIEVVKNELIKIGALNIKTCVIANRSNGDYLCDYTAFYTKKDNIVFPWDYLVMDKNNDVIVHPEYKKMSKSLGVDLNGM